jgi:uncharacterized protein YaaQ
MKMILAVIQADDASRVVQALNAAGFRVTRIATQGAWLRRENATLLVGVEDDKVTDVLRVLRSHAQRRTAYISVPAESSALDGMMGASGMPLEVEIGGATVFVLDVERMVRVSSTAVEG